MMNDIVKITPTNIPLSQTEVSTSKSEDTEALYRHFSSTEVIVITKHTSYVLLLYF